MAVWNRDLPKSFNDFATGWVTRAKAEYILNKTDDEIRANELTDEAPIELTTELKTSRKNQVKTILYAGSGLFSDGYVNNVIGTTLTILKTLYKKEVASNNAMSNIASIAFVGTVIGQLSFGYVSDKISRKKGMMISNMILAVFSILAAGAWGYKGSIPGMLNAIIVYRFFLGIGIGSEYPTGSAACAEASALMPPKHRNRYFCWFTNFAIDTGFVISSFVPMVLLWICSPKHLNTVWRVSVGIGAIWPLVLFCLRFGFQENENFRKTNFKRAHIPYWRIIKFYWFRLIIVSIIWFIYDFSAYAFGIYGSYIIDLIIPDGDMYKTFGWNIVLNLFYIPGAFLGAIAADYWGPRITLIVGLVIQAVFGYALAGAYDHLVHHVAGFVVLYGLFMTFGEFGPGDNIGCLASKTSATAIRGTYYAIPAAIGKIGAFVGTWVFPVVQKKYGLKVPYYIASSLALFAAFLGLFFLPDVSPTAMLNEDKHFLEYLASTGYDMSALGDDPASSIEEKVHAETVDRADSSQKSV